MLKTVLKSAMKTALKKNKQPKNQRNGVSLAYQPVRQHNSSTNHFRRCLYGLANVMQRRRIRGSVADMERGARHFQIAVKLLDPTMTDVFMQRKMSEAIALATRSKAVLVRRDYGYILVEFELSEKLWEYYDRSQVSGLGIGLATRKAQVNIEFSDDKAQCLIAGTGGSGKTVAIQSSLLALMNQYNPNKCKFIIVDPHKDHGQFKNESHLILPVAQSDIEITQAIKKANQLFQHRYENNIRDDYQVVVLIDEITELVDRQPELFDIIAGLTNGRKFKINVIAAAHEVNKDNLPGKDKFTNRFVGKTDITANYYATGIQGLESHKLSGKGDFYHIAHTDVTRFQVAMPNQSDFTSLERGSLQVELPLGDLDVSPRFINETSQGRPAVTLQPEILADYLQYPNLSIRKAQGLGYGRTTHNLHKEFAGNLLSELSGKGLSICCD